MAESKNPESHTRVIALERPTRESVQLAKCLELAQRVVKSVEPVADSNQQTEMNNTGMLEHPFDMDAAKELLTVNPLHSTCIGVKRDSTVGMGFVTEEMRKARSRVGADPDAPEGGTMADLVNPVETKVDEVLDLLCDDSFQSVLNAVNEDYNSIANGYIEVVREYRNGPISALWYIPGECCHIYLDGGHQYHYVVNTDGTERHWPRFGRTDSFLANADKTGLYDVDPDSLSEVIHFRKTSSLSPYYGVPNWISAISSIELITSLMQYKLDYFYNRGVPEFIFLYKGNIEKDKWQEVVRKMNGHVGPGNSHKSLAFNDPNPDAEIVVERLAMDNFSSEEEFIKTKESLDMALVSAHRVPPILAGILIPGKLGAVNEVPNSLAAFQTLVVGQDQRVFQRVLGQTLGNPRYNGGLGLVAKDFEFRRITDVMDPATLDTVSRMREPLAEAKANGRDISDGLKD